MNDNANNQNQQAVALVDVEDNAGGNGGGVQQQQQQVATQVSQVQAPLHEISRILQVQVPDSSSLEGGSSQSQLRHDVRFLAQFACQCCPGREDWLSRAQIVAMSNFPEQRLKMLEESAFKEKREIETR